MMAFKPSHRRFQSTGFGLDRDTSRGDKLPAWKKQMFNSIRNKTKQHRQTLLQRLEQQRHQNQDLSPNSKKKNANNTIDSFKNSLIDHELKQLQFNMNNNNAFNQNNVNNFGMKPNVNNNNNNNNNNLSGNGFKQNGFNMNGNNGNGNSLNGFGVNNNVNNGNIQKPQSMKFQEDTDPENLSPEQYKAIFAELSAYIEQTELSQLRTSWEANLEELEKDNEVAELEEIEAYKACNNPHVVYCPICCKDAMEIEYINNHQPVYGCLCGTKFQPRDKSVSTAAKVEKNNNMNMLKDDDEDDIDLCFDNKENNWSIESDLEHGQRMLRSLKNNLNCLMNYHLKQIKCDGKLNFAVINETGYLQAWCNKCNCNEIVI